MPLVRHRGDPMRLTPVLLPGNMCDARLWRGADGALPALLHDHGLAPACDADLSRHDRIAAMAEATLRATSGPLLPIGFSMGAIVAVEMAVQAPERIAGLVLLGYNATADLPTRAADRPVQQARVRAGGLERVLIEGLIPNYLAAANRHDPALRELLRDMGMALGPEVFVRQSEALRLRVDRRAVLAGISVPVLLGCGDEDRLCPPEWHATWAAMIGQADLFTVPGAGHMLPLETPDILALRIGQWLTAKGLTGRNAR